MKTSAVVVKLDKSLPLVKTKDKLIKRAKFNAEQSKKHEAVTIGDEVIVTIKEDLEVAIIEEIKNRRTRLIRNDPVNRKREQILAANFDQVAICTPAGHENYNYLSRALCIACNTNVPVILMHTKCDLSNPNFEVCSDFNHVIDSAYCSIVSEMKCCFTQNSNAVTSEKIFSPTKTTVLLGKSGVGKSTLINALAGRAVCETGEVRNYDKKGRHTTISREMIETPKNGKIIDMPGVRAFGLINCDVGLSKVFDEIYSLSKNCKFRNCTHTNEPGCAVLNKVDSRTLKIFQELTLENKLNSKEFHR